MNQYEIIKMANPLVALLMGSDSDLPTVKEAFTVLREFGVASEPPHVLSAHRTPKDVVKFVRNAESKGVRVVIAAAGGAAHLARFVAAPPPPPVTPTPHLPNP